MHKIILEIFSIAYFSIIFNVALINKNRRGNQEG